MSAFVVQGGRPLKGKIRPTGNKNAALPMVCAALLTDETVVIENVPAIRDVITLLELIDALGASVEWDGTNTVRITGAGATRTELPRELAERIRGSILLAGPMLARHGRVLLPPPGGDVIGRRRIDTHILALTALVTWSLAAGGTLEDRPRYQKVLCFDPFPFPNPDPETRSLIRDRAERIEQHRTEAMERDDTVTITGMYNVVEALRAGRELTAREQAIHRVAACGTLRDLHDELDALVARSYGWKWPLDRDEILARLVALHATRVAEEAAGVVGWLRPDFQLPRFWTETEPAELELRDDEEAEPVTRSIPWPSSTIEQIAALQALLANGACSVQEAARHFTGARRDIVARHLETLSIMGELRLGPDGTYHAVSAAP